MGFRSVTLNVGTTRFGGSAVETHMPDSLSSHFPLECLYPEIPFRINACPLFVLDPDSLRIVLLNEAAAKLLKVSSAECIGVTLTSFIPDDDSRMEFDGALKRLLHKGGETEGSVIEMKLQRRDGYILMTQAVSWTCRSAEGKSWLMCHISDLTCDKVVEEQLWAETQAASYQLLVECIGEGFIGLDRDGDIIFANASAEKIIGLTREQLVGRRMTDVFESSENAFMAQTFQRDMRLGHSGTLTVPVRLGGEHRQIEFSLHPTPAGMGVLFRDITDWVRHELEIAKLNATMAASQELLRRKNDELHASLQKLEQLNEELAKADRMKSDFLANTSHELRTPLNSIIGFLQIIQEGLCEDRAEEQEYMNNAMTSARHLLTLINDVLDIARIEAGKMNFLMEDHSVETILQDVQSVTYVQAQQKGLQLTFQCDGGDDLTVRCDASKLKQILINLIGNAIKFTDRGSVSLMAQIDADQPDMVYFRVQDTGIGVPIEQQEAIFQKFIQVDPTSTRRYQGTGLGLTISKNLVQMMGGRIGIHSEGLNKGSTFWFTLPTGSSLHKPVRNGVDEVEVPLPETF